MTDQDYIKEQWPIGREFEFLNITFVVSEHPVYPCEPGVGCYYNKDGSLAFDFIHIKVLRLIDIAHERLRERLARSDLSFNFYPTGI